MAATGRAEQCGIGQGVVVVRVHDTRTAKAMQMQYIESCKGERVVRNRQQPGTGERTLSNTAEVTVSVSSQWHRRSALWVMSQCEFDGDTGVSENGYSPAALA